jgi:hypothetical protein
MPRLTYANVVSTLALFLALGGASYAAVQLSRNNVRSVHIAPAQVKKSDLAPNAVNSAKVRDGKLRAQDFRPGELPAGPQGTQGPQGPAGEDGSALAYAHVLSNPTGSPSLDAANTKNVTGVAYGTSGINTLPHIYCFDLSFTPHNVVVTSDQPAVNAEHTYVIGAQLSNSHCSAPFTDAAVVVERYNHTASRFNPTDGFFVLFN